MERQEELAVVRRREQSSVGIEQLERVRTSLDLVGDVVDEHVRKGPQQPSERVGVFRTEPPDFHERPRGRPSHA